MQEGPTKADLAQLMDEYQKLDAEDHVGGVACRFRYREVGQRVPELWGFPWDAFAHAAFICRGLAHCIAFPRTPVYV